MTNGKSTQISQEELLEPEQGGIRGNIGGQPSPHSLEGESGGSGHFHAEAARIMGVEPRTFQIHTDGQPVDLGVEVPLGTVHVQLQWAAQKTSSNPPEESRQ